MLLYFFPKIKQGLGGGYPFISSVIINDNKDLFKKLGLLNPNHPKDVEGIETYIGCEIYQNNDIIIMGFVILHDIKPIEDKVFEKHSIKLYKFNRSKIDAVNNFMKDEEKILLYQSATTTLQIDKYNLHCKPILEYYINNNLGYNLEIERFKIDSK